MKNLVIEKIKEMEAIAREKNYKTEKTEGFKFNVRFDLKSVRVSGQASLNYNFKECYVRFHPGALETYKEEFIESTVVHEYAHILTYLNFPNAKPHGREFKYFMALMGSKPNRLHSYELSKCTPNVKKQERFEYQCGCGYKHMVSKTIHNRMVAGKKYRCNTCGGILTKK